MAWEEAKLKPFWNIWNWAASQCALPPFFLQHISYLYLKISCIVLLISALLSMLLVWLQACDYISLPKQEDALRSGAAETKGCLCSGVPINLCSSLASKVKQSERGQGHLVMWPEFRLTSVPFCTANMIKLLDFQTLFIIQARVRMYFYVTVWVSTLSYPCHGRGN